MLILFNHSIYISMQQADILNFFHFQKCSGQEVRNARVSAVYAAWWHVCHVCERDGGDGRPGGSAVRQEASQGAQAG